MVNFDQKTNQRNINIEELLNEILKKNETTKTRVIHFKEEDVRIQFILKEKGLEGIEEYNLNFSPRKDESYKGVIVPSRFKLSELELSLLETSSRYNPENIGGSPYRESNPVIVPSSLIKNKKGYKDFAGVLHYILPEYERIVVNEITGEEQIQKTEKYGVLVVAGYTGELIKNGGKTVFFEVSKYLSLPTNAQNVIVTPYGLTRNERNKGRKFFYEWLGKSDLHRGVYDLENRGKKQYKSPLYEELLKEYDAYLDSVEEEKRRKGIQPKLFEEF